MSNLAKGWRAMHWRRVLVMVMLAVPVAGCAVEQSGQSVSWRERIQASPGPTGSDVVYMEVVVLEQPAGDRYLNQELWGQVDEQVLPLDRKALMADNGFRIGLISGITPAGFQALLTSERSNPSPLAKRTRAGIPVAVDLGPVLTKAQFQVKKGGKEAGKPVEIKQGQCTLEVTPTLTEDGQTRLHFVPRIITDSWGGLRGITAESLNWLRVQHPGAESYDTLSWDVSLAPNEYIVVGGRYDHPRTLGNVYFVRPDEAAPVQRMLVIRTTRVQPGLGLESAEQVDSLLKSPPLALQASWTSGQGFTP